ncbi:TPA: hypothetical protein L5645_006453 [Pseudomonas aeruginosa]|uniref:hypothetical protein n=1 Tax=Pseudomonas aeruginosa TaxID=287 RepID=UPI00129885D9|nr:hypothetical protein [Pseudomonas aeruginosa]HBP5066444.1 hypothetical protein [Pseudomonas aeruginosa]
MPVMKFHSPYEAAFLPIEVTAYMLYPADEKLRNAFLTRKMAEYTVFCASEDGLESIPIEVSKDLLETPATAGADAMESLALRGAVAGEILLNLIKLNASGEDASVNKAIHLGAKYFREAQNSLENKIASGQSSIRRAWSAFMPVAHFWAALQIRVQSSANLATPITPDSYLQELSLATELGKLAPKLTSKNARKPVRPPNKLWTLPCSVELPSCTFRCHGLDEQERDCLRSYKAPSISKYDRNSL